MHKIVPDMKLKIIALNISAVLFRNLDILLQELKYDCMKCDAVKNSLNNPIMKF